MKRMMPRARGSGSRILKRTSHIRIILTDEIEIKTRDKKKSAKGKSKKSSTARKPEKDHKAKPEPIAQEPEAEPQEVKE